MEWMKNLIYAMMFLITIASATANDDISESWNDCDEDSDYDGPNPGTAWDMGFKFNFTSNDSNYNYYLYRVVKVADNEATSIRIYNISVDS